MRKRDEIDRLLGLWGAARRELLGIGRPLTASGYVGAVHCTLGARRDLHAGARSDGRIEQHWPEFPFRGSLLVINCALKQAPMRVQFISDLHWTVQKPRDKRIRAELVGISVRTYWRLVAEARARVVLALESTSDRPLHYEAEMCI